MSSRDATLATAYLKSTRPTFAGALHGPCVAIGVRYALLIPGTAFDTDRSLCLLSKE